MKKIAITTGDPAGIGPEITAKALRFYPLNQEVCWVVYGRIPKLEDGNKIIKIERVEEAVKPSQAYWLEIDDKDVKSAEPSQKSGKVAWQILNRCMQDIKAKQIDAVVTAPVSKAQIQKLHPQFIGHTEFFARKSATKPVIMSFWGPSFNISLLSTHIALQDIPQIFQPKQIQQKLRLIYNETEKFAPGSKYALLAPNPHAGEQGAFGQQEAKLKVILENLSTQGIIIDGPFPADTFFARKAENYDMIISAYHDQGLIPFKQISGNKGVNVTLGLPFLRTSVDHGTAFDIAGKGIASEESLESAMHFAESKLVYNKVFSTYSVFAKYYDKFMNHVSYTKWVKFVLEKFAKLKEKTPNNCLELACGTANIACKLVKKGIDVKACDLSDEMLKLAASKPYKPFLFQHDMLKPLPKKGYELALLLFDSINYLKTEQKIAQLLDNVYEALEPEGVFIFDISTLKNGRENFEDYVDLKDWKDEYIVHVSEFLPQQKIQKTTLIFFIKQQGFYQKIKEVHKQRIYSVEDITAVVQTSKFKLNGIYSIEDEKNYLESELTELDDKFYRVFFVLQK